MKNLIWYLCEFWLTCTWLLNCFALNFTKISWISVISPPLLALLELSSASITILKKNLNYIYIVNYSICWRRLHYLFGLRFSMLKAAWQWEIPQIRFQMSLFVRKCCLSHCHWTRSFALWKPDNRFWTFGFGAVKDVGHGHVCFLDVGQAARASRPDSWTLCQVVSCRDPCFSHEPLNRPDKNRKEFN